jgi:Flp pilus assembly protein TadD
MGKHLLSSPRGARRRPVATAASALALVLGLAACATPPGGAPSAAQSSKTLLQVADDTAAGGDPATAVTLYRRAHELAPRDPVPLAKMGAALLALQNYGAAAEAYRAALALAPTEADLHRGLGLALLAAGQPAPAMAELHIALGSDKNDPRLYSLLGVAQDMAGRHDLAQRSYERGLQLAPANVGLRNNYALSLAMTGDYNDAVERLGAIAGPNSAPRYRLNLALAYGLAGDDNKAAATARQVLDESAVDNNLAFYRLLRGMNETQRTAAILGAELHGGTVAPADVATAEPPSQAAAAAPPVAAPTAAVAVADLPPVTVPLRPAAKHDAPVPLLPHPAAAKETSAAATTSMPHEPMRVASAGPEHGLAAPARPDDAGATTKPPAVTPDVMPATTAAMDPPKTKTADKAAAASEPARPMAAPKPADTAMSDPAPDAAAPPVPLLATSKPDVAPPPATIPKPDASATAMDTAPKPDASTAPSNALPKADATPKPDASATAMDTTPKPDPIATDATPKPDVTAATDASPKADPSSPAKTLAADGKTLAAADPPAPAQIQPADPPPTRTAMAEPPQPAHEAAAGVHFVVQLGSWLAESSAHKVADDFKAKGVAVSVQRVAEHDGRVWYVVRAGDFASLEAANTACATIKSMGGVSPIVVWLHGKTPSPPAA